MSITPIRERPAPRCYGRPSLKTVQRGPRIDGTNVLLALNLLTALVVFLLAYRGSLF